MSAPLEPSQLSQVPAGGLGVEGTVPGSLPPHRMSPQGDSKGISWMLGSRSTSCLVNSQKSSFPELILVLKGLSTAQGTAGSGQGDQEILPRVLGAQNPKCRGGNDAQSLLCYQAQSLELPDKLWDAQKGQESSQAALVQLQELIFSWQSTEMTQTKHPWPSQQLLPGEESKFDRTFSSKLKTRIIIITSGVSVQ